MKFPNAYKGVNKLLTAEILSLVCALGATVLAGLTKNQTPESAGAGLSTVILVCGVAVLVLSLVAGIITLSGLKTASLDEESFNKGFTMAIISLALTLAAGILGALKVDNKTITDFMEAVSNVADTAVTFYIVQGIINLARKLNNQDMVGRGNKVFTIFAVAIIGAAVIGLVAKIIAKDSPAMLVTGIAALVMAVLNLVGYFAYLRYLDNAKTMLS